MRLAILADIHGNVLALEAVMADLRDASPDLVVNLGDCLSGPLWPLQTADILLAQNWPTVRGNHDRYLLAAPQEMPPGEKLAHESIAEAHRDWLRALPPVRRLDDMLLFHAQPGRDDAYLMERVTKAGDLVAASARHVTARLRGEQAPLMLCGHTHIPRLMQAAPGALIVNPGSVGCPGFSDDAPVPHAVEVGSPHARYALATRRGEGWAIDLRAVGYDHGAASRRAEDNGRPHWARALATGFVRG